LERITKVGNHQQQHQQQHYLFHVFFLPFTKNPYR
jgi:hypothetical protein